MRPLFVLLLLAGPALGQIKISAIGASTTQGSGAPAGQSYPDQLQKLLGSEYQVRNFGKSGAGALRAGNPTYWNSAEQKAAAAFAPDIVINWLGGADSKAASWDAHKAEFLGDYKAMIKYYQDLPSRPKIISMMSIALHDDAGVRKTVLEAEVNPLQRQGALEMGSRFIDTKSIVDGHPEYFNDGVHLKAIGYAAIAKAVEAEVRALAADRRRRRHHRRLDLRRHLRDERCGRDRRRRSPTPPPRDHRRRHRHAEPTPGPTADAATTTEPPGPDGMPRPRRPPRATAAPGSPGVRAARWGGPTRRPLDPVAGRAGAGGDRVALSRLAAAADGQAAGEGRAAPTLRVRPRPRSG